MKNEAQTNFLYLADSLSSSFPAFAERFVQSLQSVNFSYAFLPGTKDIWAKDYMPIQFGITDFVQFIYRPSYLFEPEDLSHTISEVDAICQAIGITPIKSDILVDGGNVVHYGNKVIMTDRVFEENEGLSRYEVIAEMEGMLDVSGIIFIPADGNDYCGHADAMVRFLDEKTVLMNAYKYSDKKLAASIQTILKQKGFEIIPVPYNVYNNDSLDSAVGTYINFLEMEQAIFVPIFNREQDENAMNLFEQLYPGRIIVPLLSTEIAEEGGVLNCISWNIYKSA